MNDGTSSRRWYGIFAASRNEATFSRSYDGPRYTSDIGWCRLLAHPRADGQTGVTGDWLNEQLIDGGAFHDVFVHLAVECDTTGEADVPDTEPATVLVDDIHDSLTQEGLNSPSQVFLPIRERGLVGDALSSEYVFESVGTVPDAFGCDVGDVVVDTELCDLTEPAFYRRVPFTVRCQPHDLSLAVERVKAQKLRNSGKKEPETVRLSVRPDALQISTGRPPHYSGVEFTSAVDCEDECVGKLRRIVGTSSVGLVVRDGFNWRHGLPERGEFVPNFLLQKKIILDRLREVSQAAFRRVGNDLACVVADVPRQNVRYHYRIDLSHINIVPR
jgi:hypothetical protein